MRITTTKWGQWVTVLAVCGVNFFLHAGAPEVSLMEARNLVAAREMVAGGSWLIPTMNGELRLAKPPLPTWAVAAWQQLIGPTEDLGLLRVPAGLAATLLVLFFWGLARELTRPAPGEARHPGRTAWLAALVLASSLLVVTTGREGQWDIFATSLMMGSLWLLVRGWQRPRRAWRPLLGAGALAGLSLLSKGPVAVYALLLPFVGAYLLTQAQHRRQVKRHGWATLAAGIVALLLGGSWPVYIWQEVAPVALKVARTEMSSWGERHVQPLWYYWSFFAFTGLWALVALASLIMPYARPRAGRFIPYAVALGWVLGGVVLLSLVPEKKERYMLPLMPALALLSAGMLRYWETTLGAARPRPDAWLVRGWGSLLTVVFAALPVAMVLSHLPGLGWATPRFILGALLFGGLASWVCGWGVRRSNVGVLISATLVGVAAIIALLAPAYPLWEARKQTPGLRRMAAMRTVAGLAGLATWRSLDTLPIKQVWAAGRTVAVWYPTADTLQALRKPVAVFSASPITTRLPVGWDTRVRVTPLDTFFLGRDPQSGYWFVSRLDPILE
ncbi:4-amino-4-deoxy-L-arabinose transferase-like glycosyltransferase [Hymenobacter luteus]|uniref:4-amino-4-deoxy-L-arabinose transferase-like glycosyltransferase n=2 Tax=Hymenobacter TaxID=89966 RepID=A0A7W9T0X6_9BACT|nr:MULTISPECIES: glycosyltransferase family 39 protein [Hymenobacter]MBB4601989.1 4-amino-4-deoxy-L-arabinose transferase-like glycosyltransferase [Hymenobacter latericoloratus]MBB6059582.1 4-amino-4-deoxy-L-arabinose transferase-like glycosyltransferase [Hymenobacter luteus]